MLGTQGHQHIEHHPHPGQILGGKFAAGLIGVDDQRLRQGIARQVMVGNQYFNAQLTRPLYPGHAGNAVVHGNNDVRLALRCQLDNFRRQAIAVLKAVGDDEVHLAAQHGQALYRNRAGGCAIGIVIGHHQHALAA